jgi:hypothetical protein
MITKNVIPNVYQTDRVQKVCLTLALSYCFTIIDGLVLLMTIGLTVLAFVSSIWVLVLLTEFAHRYAMRNCEAIGDAGSVRESGKYSSLLMLATSFILLFSSYAMVFVTGPLSGVLSGDIPRYAMYANEFLNYSSTIEPYVWFQAYLWVTSRLTGLPFLYSYVFMQFYNILLPLSVFVLVKTVSPESRKAAPIAFFAVALVQGMTALGFWWTLRNPDLSSGYFGGNTFDVLNEHLFKRIGSGNLPVFIFSAATIEISMFLLALCFVYRLLGSKENRTPPIILSTLFICVAIFTHSVMLPLCFIVVVCFLAIPQRQYKSLLEVVLLLVALLLLFDILSDFWLSALILGNLLIIASSFNATSLAIMSLGVIAILLTLGLVRVRKIRAFPMARILKSCKLRVSRLLQRRNAKKFLLILASVIFVASVYFCFANYDNTDVTRAWYGPYLYPWYVFLFKYGFVFFLAIILLPLMIRKHGRPTRFFLILTFSLSLLAAVGLVVNIQPQIWTNRYLVYIFLPLVCLVAIGIDASYEKPSSMKTGLTKSHTRALLLVVMVSISFVSYAYVTELYCLSPSARITESEQASVNWINNNLPSSSVILPTSEYTYMLLCSTTFLKALPLMKTFSPSVPYSWLHDIVLSDPIPEDLLYILQKLNVSYIYSRDEDVPMLQGSGLALLFAELPLIFLDTNIKIYRVPPMSGGYNPQYPDDLFRFIVPSSVSLLYLEGLHGYLVYYNGLQIQGNSNLTSERMSVACENLSVSSLSLVTPSNGTLTYSNEVIYDLVVEGQGAFTSTSSAVSPTDSYRNTSYLTCSSVCLRLTNSTVSFKLNATTTIGPFNGSTVVLTTSSYLNISAEEPKITIQNGSARGDLEGCFFHNGSFFYSMNKDQFSLTGSFTLSVEWSSGPFITRIYDIQNVQVS